MGRSFPYTISFILLSLILWAQSLSAENQYSFTQIGLYQGMPSRISTVYEESNGLIWLAHSGGLLRYDGRKLKSYDNIEGLDVSYHHGLQVRQFLEDDRRQLWVLTDLGLARYSPQEDCFKAFNAQGTPLLAGAACKVSDGLILGGSDSLYKYTYDTGRVTALRPLDTKEFFIQRMVLWDARTLVCSDFNNRLIFYDLATGSTQPVELSEQNKISGLCIGPDGYLWVADYNVGVKKIARDGRTLARYTAGDSGLSCNLVLDVAAIDGRIWVATDGGGINIINPATGEIEILIHETDNRNSLPVNTILSLHGSLEKNGVWVSTARRGLINIRRANIQTFQNVPMGYPHGLSEKTVLALFQEPGNDTIWIGTDGGGVNRLETSDHTFTHYPATQSDKIVSICSYSPNKLLVSIFSRGLYLFDKQTGRKEPCPLDAPEINRSIFYSGIPVNLFNETDRSILLLTQPVMRYRPESGRLERIEQKPGQEISGMICPIGKDGHYSYLYDTRSIYRLAFGSNQLECLYRNEDAQFIHSVYRDDSGVFWIACIDGIYRFDGTSAQSIEHPFQEDVTAVLCDHNGQVWIGVGQDLVSYSSKEKRFMLYGEADGALKNEYLAKPVLLSRNGEIYMGGVNGLLCIDPSVKQHTPAVPDTGQRVILTDLQIGERNCMSKLSGGSLTVPGNSRNIKIGFLVSGDDILRPRLFRYSLGDDRNNAITTSDADLNIPTLAAGRYPIYVTYTHKDGSWSTPQQMLVLTVLPIWYKSWWFITLLMLFLAGSIGVGVLFLLKRKDERHKWMLSQQEHRINEEKVRFLINISHELRTPLTLIYSPLKKVIGTLRPGDAYFKPLTTVFRQSRRMKDLIDMVLDVRKLEEGMDRPTMRPHQLNAWVEEVCSDFTDEDGEPMIECTVDPQIGQVTFDREKCRTVLSNLLINAIKHQPKGGGKVQVRTTLSDDRQSVQVSVSDRGPGLRGVDATKLFTRFYQGDGELQGSGLGLSYAKLLVSLHHGRMGASDNADGGATFYFELPLVQEGPGKPSDGRASYLNELLAPLSQQDIEIPVSDESAHLDLRHYTVLIADDNPELIDYMTEELRPRFQRVLTAFDGETAYRLAREEQPDILVSDVMMPDMNGYELCKAIREDIDVCHIPIILLTARDDAESRQYGLRLGADSYLGKPFEMEQLLEKMRNKLYNRMLTQRHHSHIGQSPTPPGSDDLTAADNRFMEQLQKVVIEHIDNPRLDIPYLCTLMGMSRTSIYNKLKAITGMGANDYINKIRIEQAMKLLRESGMNITEISEKVGFASPKYFSTSFKQYTGKTPSQYKKEY